MSHKIIIINRAAAPAAASTEAVEDSPVEYEVTYAPPHDLTPAQVGQKVGRILRVLAKLNEPEDAPE